MTEPQQPTLSVTLAPDNTPPKEKRTAVPSMHRLPTLEDVAKRLVPNATGAASGATPAVSVSPASSSARPRLPASILSARSSAPSVILASDSSIPAASSSKPSISDNADSEPTEVPAIHGLEPPKDLPKDKIHRGYKNVPSLDAITERMRARSASDTPVAALANVSISDQKPSTDEESSQAASVEGGASIIPDSTETVVPTSSEAAQLSPSDDHPLQHTWTLYHDSKSRGTPSTAEAHQSQFAENQDTHSNIYAAGLTVVGEFETVENFCRYMNWLKPPSQLELNSNYHLFKSGIKPMWEDPANANGGKWVITMKSNPKLLDRCWSWLSMGLVGEEIDERDEICGAVVSLRPRIDRIQIWTRSKDDVERINSIGKKIVKLLDISNEPTVGLEFQYHSDDRVARSKFIYISPSGGSAFGRPGPPGHGMADQSMGNSSGWRGGSSAFGRGGGAFGGTSSVPVAHSRGSSVV